MQPVHLAFMLLVDSMEQADLWLEKSSDSSHLQVLARFDDKPIVSSFVVVPVVRPVWSRHFVSAGREAG